MNPAQKSKRLFLLGCIPMRLLLAYIAYALLKNSDKSDNKTLLHAFVAVTVVIGVGFWAIYLNGWRKTGTETFGQQIWWNSLRPVHGSIYLLFSLAALLGYKDAWVLLFADVCLGVIAELHRGA
jgi:hypothetical protein